MVEYSNYRQYVTHNRLFNIFFSTTVAIIISVVLGLLLHQTGFITSNWGVAAIIILLSIPMIIFVKEYQKYEGVIAYHYQWSDCFHGLIDQRAINQDYGKTHNIYDWKQFFAENNPDGRWNYHVNTKYMERLAISRNNILVGIANEYADKRGHIESMIRNTEEEQSNIKLKLQGQLRELESLERKLSTEHPGAQQYHLECERRNCIARINEMYDELTACTQRINNHEAELESHDIAFVAQSNRVKQDYEIRSNKYAKIAIKQIAKNGLKYEVGSLKKPDYWISNPMKGAKYEI